MNNSVYYNGQCVGFRCWRCGTIYQSGWGVYCNACTHQDEENAKLRAEIRRLTEAISKVKEPTV